MAEYTVTPLAYIVRPEKAPIFSESATTVRIEDDAAGEFIIIDQSGTGEYGKIAVSDKTEWDAICSAVEALFNEVREND